MSAPQRYFAVAPGIGHPHPRYAVLDTDGRTVVGLQISRPDGVEIRPPGNVRWQLRPFVGGDGPRTPAPARFHNVGAAAHQRARHNANRREPDHSRGARGVELQGMSTFQTRRPWTAAERALVAARYPHEPTSVIARALGRSAVAVFNVANAAGLHKTAAGWRAEAEAKWGAARMSPALRAHQFPKGHAPANKGVKGWQAGGRSRETQFKPGHTYWDPEIYCVGALRINHDGELEIKVVPGSRSWIALGRYVWAMEFGRGRLPPRGYKVCYRNGDNHDTRPENLELRSDAEVMRRNTIHNLPRPLAQVIQLQGVLKRRLRNLEGKHAA